MRTTLNQRKHWAIAACSVVVLALVLSSGTPTRAGGGPTDVNANYTCTNCTFTVPNSQLPTEVDPAPPSGKSSSITIGAPQSTSAAGSHQVHVTLNQTFSYGWNRWSHSRNDTDPLNQPQPLTSVSGWEAALSNPDITVSYDMSVIDTNSGAVISPNGIVRPGQTITLKYHPLIAQDISWFGTGYTMDSPYGQWRAGATAPALSAKRVTCDSNDYITNVNFSDGTAAAIFGTYIPLVVAPPSRTVSNTSGLSCGGASVNGDGSLTYNCTVTASNTTINPSFDVSSTYGYFYYRYTDNRSGDPYGVGSPFVPGCYGNNIPLVAGTLSGTSVPDGYQVSIPALSYQYPLQVSAPANNPPAAPTITGPASGYTSTTYGYTFTATDPDGNTIRYGVDWNNDGTIDEWLPASGYVASGSGQSENQIWNSAGTYTFKALTQDSNGANSGWTSYSVTIATVNHQPTAALDQGTCTTASGWAFDQDTPSQSIGVHMYIDGAIVSAVTANQSRPDVQTAYGLPMSNYGFTIPVPSSYSDGQTHTLRVYAIDSAGGPNPNFGTATFNCPAPAGTPTNPQVSCNAAGTQATLSWGAASNATFYYVRVNPATASCPAGWQVSGWGPCIPNPDSVTATSIVYPTVPGQAQPGWYVYGANGSGYNPTPIISPASFTCTAPTPTASLTLSPSSVSYGGASTVSWSSTNATTCTGTGFSTGGATSGSVVVSNVTTNTTYRVDCSGSGGSAWAASTLTVGSQPLPDLTAAPGPALSLIAGQTTALSATVSNIGNASTGATFHNEWQITQSDQATVVYNGNSDIGALANGASANTSNASNYSFPNPGTYYYRVCADNNFAVGGGWAGSINESNENNNCSAWQSITVVPQAPTNPSHTCSADGTRVSFSWTGSTGATNYYPRMYAPSGTQCNSFGWQVYNVDGATCYPNPDSYTGTSVSSFPITPGQNYTWYTFAGTNGSVNWSQSVSENFTCGNTLFPDLTASPGPAINLVAGQTTTLTGTVSNIGNATTGAGFHNEWQITRSDQATVVYNGNSDIGTLAVNGSTGTSNVENYNFPTAGTYYYRVCADINFGYNGSWSGNITESNENNNCSAWAAINVAQPTVSCTPNATTVNTGDTVIYTASPGGGATAPYSWTDSDGTTGTGLTFARLYTVPGIYQMQVKASNTSNAFCSPSQVTVNANWCTTGTTNMSISASPRRVPSVNTSIITWSATNVLGQNGTCTVSGPGLNQTQVASLKNASPSCSVSGAQSVVINTQSTYCIVCGGAKKCVTVNVVPKVQEF